MSNHRVQMANHMQNPNAKARMTNLKARRTGRFRVTGARPCEHLKGARQSRGTWKHDQTSTLRCAQMLHLSATCEHTTMLVRSQILVCKSKGGRHIHAALLCSNLGASNCRINGVGFDFRSIYHWLEQSEGATLRDVGK